MHNKKAKAEANVGSPPKRPPQKIFLKTRKETVKIPPKGKEKNDAKTGNKNTPEKNNFEPPKIGVTFKKDISKQNKKLSAKNTDFSLILLIIKSLLALNLLNIKPSSRVLQNNFNVKL